MTRYDYNTWHNKVQRKNTKLDIFNFFDFVNPVV